MKLLLLVLCAMLLIVGCGGDSSESSNRVASQSKWTDTQMTRATQSCANKGTQYTHDQWVKFCGCVYADAATKWTFKDFIYNFDACYDQLVAEKVVSNCEAAAGMK